MKVKIIAALTVLVLGLLVAVVSAQTATPTAATNPNEAAPSHLGELISSAKASGKAVTFDFIVPLVTGERVWTVPDDTLAQQDVNATLPPRAAGRPARA